MPQFVVLLRGVNVGKANRVAMRDFKLALQGIGYTAVTTLFNSGNAVFSSPSRAAKKHAEAISGLLQAKFNVTTPVIVKTAAEFTAIVQGSPMVPDEAGYARLLVVFAQSRDALQCVFDALPEADSAERLVLTDEAIYLQCTQGLLQSKVAEALLGKVARSVTTRNWATVLKLKALLNAA